jgi:hypothetical protein
VQPDWDWCHQCGYDPEGLRPLESDLVGATMTAAPPKSRKQARLAARAEKKAAEKKVRVTPADVPPTIDLRPPPPRRPTETVYGPLPYDVPSSVAPVEPEEPDNSERTNRRFSIVALCVIIVGLALLAVTIAFG